MLLSENISKSVLVSSSIEISYRPDLDSIKKTFQHSYTTLHRSKSLQFCHLACEHKSESVRWLLRITFKGRILSYVLIFFYEILLCAVNVYNFFLFLSQVWMSAKLKNVQLNTLQYQSKSITVWSLLKTAKTHLRHKGGVISQDTETGENLLFLNIQHLNGI